MMCCIKSKRKIRTDVLPSRFWIFGSPPFSNIIFTDAILPRTTADCNGVAAWLSEKKVVSSTLKFGFALPSWIMILPVSTCLCSLPQVVRHNGVRLSPLCGTSMGQTFEPQCWMSIGEQCQVFPILIYFKSRKGDWLIVLLTERKEKRENVTLNKPESPHREVECNHPFLEW